MSSVNCTKLCKQHLITLFMCNLFGMQANRSFLVEIVMKFNPITGGFSGINCTPFSSNFVSPSVKAILAVVSGALLIQTNIFMLNSYLIFSEFSERN